MSTPPTAPNQETAPSRRAGDRLRLADSGSEDAGDAPALAVWENFQRIEREAIAAAAGPDDDERFAVLGVWDNFQRLEKEARFRA